MTIPTDVVWALRVKPTFGGDEAIHARKILARYTAKQIDDFRRHLAKPIAEETPVLRAITTPRDGYGWRGLSNGSRMLDKDR